MRFDYLDEIFHAQIDVHALAIDKECRHGVHLRILSPFNVFENALLKLRRIHSLQEYLRVDPDTSRQGGKYQERLGWQRGHHTVVRPASLRRASLPAQRGQRASRRSRRPVSHDR